MQIREEAFIDESRSFGATVAVVDADVRGGGRSEDLTLILKTVIGLRDGDGEVAGGVWFKVSVPEKSVGVSPETAIERTVAQTQHDLSPTECVRDRNLYV